MNAFLPGQVSLCSSNGGPSQKVGDGSVSRIGTGVREESENFAMALLSAIKSEGLKMERAEGLPRAPGFGTAAGNSTGGDAPEEGGPSAAGSSRSGTQKPDLPTGDGSMEPRGTGPRETDSQEMTNQMGITNDVRRFEPPRVDDPARNPVPTRAQGECLARSRPVTAGEEAPEGLNRTPPVPETIAQARAFAPGELERQDGPDSGPRAPERVEPTPSSSSSSGQAPSLATPKPSPSAVSDVPVAATTAGDRSAAPARATTAGDRSAAPASDLPGPSDSSPSETVAAPSRELADPAVGAQRSTGISAAWVPDHDLSKLVPEFREKLDTVIRRMETEYGHRVEVVEAHRTPERQDLLFAQGRTRPGPVVTWTRHSLHLEGRAADVRIDGSWQSPLGYARLHQIAQEEGLRTLGPRDPGHLELPPEGRTGNGSRPGTHSEQLVGDGVRRRVDPVQVPARVARTAPVASPASPESVARVARVATPANVEASPVRSSSRAATASTLGEPSEGSAARRAAASSPEPAPGQRAVRPTSPEPLPAQQPAQQQGVGMAEVVPAGSAGSGSSAVPSVAFLSAGASVERALSMRDAFEAIPVRNVHLDLPNADGEGTRLRLDLRGSSLGATMDLQDPATADLMRSRVNELHRALSRAGLDPESLRIQIPSLRPSGAEALKEMAVSARESLRVPGAEPLTTTRNEPSGGRSHGEANQGRQDRQRYRDQSQQHKDREEAR